VTAFRKYSRGGLVIIDEGFRQIAIALPARAAFDFAEAISFLDLVQPVDASLDRHPGQKEISHRGVIACICARVLVALASWRAAGSLKVLRSSTSSGITSYGAKSVTIPSGGGIALLGENMFLFLKNISQ
jgi:hypothetical protein